MGMRWLAAEPARGRCGFAHALAMLVLALWCAVATAWEAGSDGLMPIPALRDRVTDLTQTLSPQESQALERRLAQRRTERFAPGPDPGTSAAAPRPAPRAAAPKQQRIFERTS